MKKTREHEELALLVTRVELSQMSQSLRTDLLTFLRQRLRDWETVNRICSQAVEQVATPCAICGHKMLTDKDYNLVCLSCVQHPRA